MANPPFNQKEWRGVNELLDDPRWAGYSVPSTSNANAFILCNLALKLDIINNLYFFCSIIKLVNNL